MVKTDKHLNIYYSYDMKDRIGGEGQLEDNVTRALCVCLMNSDSARMAFFSLIEPQFKVSGKPDFDLQSIDNNTQLKELVADNTTRKLLLGIVPDSPGNKEPVSSISLMKFEDINNNENIVLNAKKKFFEKCLNILEKLDSNQNEPKDIDDMFNEKKIPINIKDIPIIKEYLTDIVLERKSRLDAWLFNVKKKWIIGIENKLYSGISNSQWNRHISKELKKGNLTTLIVTWKEIYEGLKEIHKKVEIDTNEKDIFLNEFIEYLEVINLLGFSGIKNTETMYEQKDTLKLLVNEIQSDIIDYYDRQNIILKRKGTFKDNWIVFYEGRDFKKSAQLGIQIKKEIFSVYLLIPNNCSYGWKNLERNLDSVINELIILYHNNPIPYLEFNIYQRHGKGTESVGQTHKLYKRKDSNININLELLMDDKNSSKLEHSAIKRQRELYSKLINSYAVIHDKNANIECSIEALFYLNIKSEEHKTIVEGTKKDDYIVKHGNFIDPRKSEIKPLIVKILKEMFPAFKILSKKDSEKK